MIRYDVQIEKASFGELILTYNNWLVLSITNERYIPIFKSIYGIRLFEVEKGYKHKHSSAFTIMFRGKIYAVLPERIVKLSPSDIKTTPAKLTNRGTAALRVLVADMFSVDVPVSMELTGAEVLKRLGLLDTTTEETVEIVYKERNEEPVADIAEKFEEEEREEGVLDYDTSYDTEFDENESGPSFEELAAIEAEEKMVRTPKPKAKKTNTVQKPKIPERKNKEIPVYFKSTENARSATFDGLVGNNGGNSNGSQNANLGASAGSKSRARIGIPDGDGPISLYGWVKWDECSTEDLITCVKEYHSAKYKKHWAERYGITGYNADSKFSCVLKELESRGISLKQILGEESI